METILKEIDDAIVVDGEYKMILEDHKEGLVSTETASLARGYPKGEAEKAAKDHEERLERIAISQAKGGGMAAAAPGARGMDDHEGDPYAGKKEKAKAQNQDKSDSNDNGKRGDAK
jgi:hypothetical protein